MTARRGGKRAELRRQRAAERGAPRQSTRVEREYPRPIDRDLAASIEAMAAGLGPASRMTAARIVCRLRGIDPEELDPRSVARLQGRGAGWLVDSGERPTARPCARGAASGEAAVRP